MSDWNQFRSDHENSGHRRAPTLEDPDRPDTSWETEISGSVEASPVLDRDTVYIGSSAGNVYAFDRYEGRRRWVFETQLPIDSALVVTGESLFVVASDGTVFALDPETGELRWEAEVSGGVESAPTLSRGVLFIGHVDGVSALAAETGEELWFHETDAGVVGTPATTDRFETDHVYVGTYQDEVLALETATGEEVWTAPTNGAVVGGPTVVPGNGGADGTDPLGSDERLSPALSSKASDADTESGSSSALGDDSGRDIDTTQEVDPADDTGIASTAAGTDLESSQTAVDTAESGQEHLAVDGDIDAGSGDRVYVADEGGLLVALNAETGQSWFTYEIRDSFTTAPTVTDDSVFAGASDGYLHITDTMFGKRKLRGWLFAKKGINLDGVAHAEPAVVGDTLCLGDSSGSVYGIDVDEPDFGWHYPLEEGVSSGPAVSDGSLYVVTDDGRLCCLSWRDETAGWD
ncbi:PQQ-binding-like beta-propeller repeat protein [Halostagnicola sp. A-GB9-2]|uniref:outer membrane protein assembly factor BamB family protein n=1 Tax=Halostagnicola sp. A-GB9-2 TaxID=3048066 RepID=UPI0024BF9ED9|nr:PQQ-binding-like beta-propeller repeat protein [Halostagnicola sp. A-GB9-2]MDJ1432931.1 PQQ-binding-like beta-propeller repeat protein [Halostagnicola sp. A-GB9-2]